MKIFKSFVLVLSLLAGRAHADPPATHGMLIFGDKVTYASHLPMFHSPHDYQLIMKIDLKKSNLDSKGKTLEAYDQLKATGESLFTVEPAVMDLTHVINGQTQAFAARLYKGHFERGGVLLGPVVVVVKKILLSQKLNPSDQEKNFYTVFGEGGEYFAAHVINGKPSFDLILKVTSPVINRHGHCRVPSRICDGEMSSMPFPDEKLPTQLLFMGSNPIPLKGSHVGGFGVSTSVLDTIYFESQELAH